MMAKIKSGRGFAGLVDYAKNIKSKESNVIAHKGVDLTSDKSIVASFNLQAKSRPTLTNYAGHISLAFAPEDAPKLSDERMAEIAKEYLSRMGIVNTQYVMFRHHDTAHPHIHIVYNRVDNEGNSITKDQNFKRSVAITKELTREYGLTFGKGKRRVNRDRLKGKDAVKYRIYDTVTDALALCHSWAGLKNYLRLKGITLNHTYKIDGRIKGVVFTCDNISFGGYQIDRSLTYRNINRILSESVSRAKSPASASKESGAQGFSFGGNNSNDAPLSSCTEQFLGQNENGSSDSSPIDSGSSMASNLGGAAIELVMQAHEAVTLGGGGSDNNRWDDDDKTKERNPYRRRR